jgi:hypothetical protein
VVRLRQFVRVYRFETPVQLLARANFQPAVVTRAAILFSSQTHTVTKPSPRIWALPHTGNVFAHSSAYALMPP